MTESDSEPVLPGDETRVAIAETAIRELATSGRIKPGVRLSAQDLAVRLGISRTAVRQAIHRLTQSGVLSPEHGSGPPVRPLPAEEFAEAMQVRAALESMAGWLAATRIRARDIRALRTVGHVHSKLDGVFDFAMFVLLGCFFEITTNA